MTRNGKLRTTHEILGQVIFVPISLIRPFPNQPRKFFDPVKLQELAKSIKAVGQKVPGLVKELSEPDGGGRYQYELVDGQRRWHAVDMAGVGKMKVIVVEVKDEAEQFLTSIVANFGRADHNPIEVANAIQRFLNDSMTVIQITEVFAKSDSWVYQHIKLLQLDGQVQQMMSQEIAEEERLIFSVGLLLTDIPKERQLKFAQKIVKNKWGLTQAKHYIKQQAEKLGLTVGDPNRTPRKDYASLCNLVKKTIREFGLLRQMPQPFFDKMFEFREDKDLAKLIEKVEEIFDNLNPLLSALDKVKKKK